MLSYRSNQPETRLVAEPVNAAFRAPDPSIFDPPSARNRTTGARARMRTTGWIAGDGNVVQSAEDAASLLADIRKNAQETVYSVVTDKDGLVLEIHRYSKGTSGAAPLNAVEFVGRAINIPGAAKLYWVHNHPGGLTTPSPEDLASHQTISRLARLGGMEAKGIVIAGTKWADLDDPSISRPIRPSLRKVKVPVKERVIARPSPTGESPFCVMDSSDARKALGEMFANKEGWLLLDIKNRVVGFQEFVPGRGAGRQAAGLIRTAERLNASRAIFFSRTEPASGTERAKFLRGVCSLTRDSLALLDVLYGENGSMAGHQRMKEITHTAFPGLDFEILRDDQPVFYRGVTRARRFLAANPKARVFKTVAEAMRHWENPPPVRVCGSEQELPAEVAMFARSDETVFGAFWNGTVYLIANRLPDRSTTLKVLFHETIGHYGFSLLGEAGKVFLDRLYRSKHLEIRELAARHNIPLDDDSGRRLAAEEWLAHQAASWPRTTWVDRGVRAVKDWIRNKLRIGLKVSGREVRAWLADMRRVVIQGPDGKKKSARASMRRWSRLDTANGFKRKGSSPATTAGPATSWCTGR